MPERTKDLIKDLDLLVINSLRPEKHMTHLNLQQSLDVIKETSPKKAYLTHMSHQMGLHEEVNKNLPSEVSLAYDGLSVAVSL